MKRAEPGWLVLAIAGIAALIGSFLPFYTFGRGVELTVWNRSLFPTATLIPLLVFGIGLEGLFVLLMGYEPRSPFLSFTWSQARLAGTAFAIVLALSYLVQGRAGGSLGSGYVILSLAAVASFAGAVLTRRAELARGREEITVPAEHPWRAAFLRWRRELTAKVNSYAAGGREPAQPSPPTETMPSLPGEEPDDTSEIETPEPTPVPRLSAVQSEPEPEEEPAADGDEPTTDGDKPTTDEETAGESEAVADREVAVAAAAETETEASADDKAAGETERDDEEPERERPAAPG
jgi:outer membrane biosynthesis protein TonB